MIPILMPIWVDVWVMLCQVRRIDSDLAWPREARPWNSLIESGLGLEHDLLSVALALDTQAMAL